MTRLVFILTCALTILLFPAVLFAQEQDIENLQIGVETAGQLLADISVTHFEDADTWSANMPLDHGVILSMKRKGRPIEVPEIDPKDGTASEYVLGVKVAFTQRGYARFTLYPMKPIKIPGITKAVSVWVCGRSFKHRLFLHVLDYRGNPMVLDMGLLDFVGWKKLIIAIPSAIEQHNYHNTQWRGLSISGIYSEENRDEDDMEDGW